MSVGELRLGHAADGYSHRLCVGGELDMATVPELYERLATVLAEAPSSMVLDIEELVFMDSSGLRAILNVRDLCSAMGCELSITIAQTQVQRVFEISGMADVLPFRDS